MLRCLAVPGDGLGPQEHDDGGILGTVMAAGFKGNESIETAILLYFACRFTVLKHIFKLEFQEKKKVLLKENGPFFPHICNV